MSKLSIHDLDLDGKRVFVRVDFNVPIKNGTITDDTRIRASLPTIRYALDHGAIVVLDDSGNIVSAQREDGASMFRIDVAKGKAWGAVAMGASSKALAKRAKDNPNFFVTLAATAGGKFLPQTGAALVKDKDGTILGAAGASGGTGEEDEAACVAGIEAAGLTADASA